MMLPFELIGALVRALCSHSRLATGVYLGHYVIKISISTTEV